MRIWLKIILITITLSVLFVSFESNTIAFSASDTEASQGVQDARTKLQEAFNATVFADMIGTNVTQAVKNMNTALDYISQAEAFIAQGKFDQAIAQAQASIHLSEETTAEIKELQVQQGLFNFYTKLVLPVVAAAVLLGVGVYASFYGRRLWKKRQEKKFIEMKVKTNNKPTISSTKDTDSHQSTDEEKMILVAVLSAIIVITGLLVIVSLPPAPQENFVSFYILNSEKKAYDYPELLVLGKNSTYTFWVGVANFMNRIEYGVVYVKMANASQPEETEFTFGRILLNTEKWEIPVAMSFNKTGVYRITSELWLYNEMKAVFTEERFVSLSPLRVVAES